MKWHITIIIIYTLTDLLRVSHVHCVREAVVCFAQLHLLVPKTRVI